MNETNTFDIYLSLIRRFGAKKVRIAEKETIRRDSQPPEVAKLISKTTVKLEAV